MWQAQAQLPGAHEEASGGHCAQQPFPAGWVPKADCMWVASTMLLRRPDQSHFLKEIHSLHHAQVAGLICRQALSQCFCSQVTAHRIWVLRHHNHAKEAAQEKVLTMSALVSHSSTSHCFHKSHDFLLVKAPASTVAFSASAASLIVIFLFLDMGKESGLGQQACFGLTQALTHSSAEWVTAIRHCSLAHGSMAGQVQLCATLPAQSLQCAKPCSASNALAQALCKILEAPDQ